MPKQTDKYRLGYFVAGELTDQETEARRWNTVDNLLRGLYQMVGDGVASGWNLAAGDGLAVDISIGRGVIANVAVESSAVFTLTSLIPSTTNLIYAILTTSSYWDGGVTFQATVEPYTGDGVLLGEVVTDETNVVSVNNDVRTEIGIINGILEAVSNHRHNGADGNPSQVDLSSEVRGTLSQSNIPDLDASKITGGTLPLNVIPKIDHLNGLDNVGALTHSELDSFADQLSHANRTLMGENALINFLQLLLSLKPSDPDIDRDMVNELTFIPGYSPDGFIDTENTTATVDKVLHKITVAPTGAMDSFSKSWQGDRLNQATTWQTTTNGAIRLQPTERQTWIEDFEDVSDWEVRIQDLSSENSLALTPTGNNSAILAMNKGVQGNIALFMEKTFAAQDWTDFRRIVFNLKTSDLDHGDVYFYLNNASSQSQKILVLPAGAPTINQDTLVNGWQEVSVDLTNLDRDEVESIGFTTSTEDDWNPSREFSMEVGEMYLTTGNCFLPAGTATFVTGTEGFPVVWSAIRWAASIPSDASLRLRWRQASTTAGLAGATWSAYSNTGEILTGNTDPYALLQIEARFGSSSDYLFSPELMSLDVTWEALSSEDSFVVESQEQWESGSGSNLDTTSTPGSIKISGINEVSGFTYAANGQIIKADDSLATTIALAGSALPRSTNQVVNQQSAGFGQISSLDFGADNSLWLADTDNDRVVQIAADGSLLCGFYGSHLTEPQDPYGDEEQGPGSNTDEDTITEPTASTTAPLPLHAFYNQNTGMLSVIFDANLEKIHDDATTFDPSRIHLALGTQRFYFDAESECNLWGIDGTKLDRWKNTGNVFLQQFKQNSHILQITLSQADRAALESIANFAVVGLTCAGPTVNQIYPEGDVEVSLIASNVTIGSENVTVKTNLKRPNGLWDGWVSRTTGSFTIPSLTSGRYQLDARLVDATGAEYANAEAKLVIDFGVTSAVQAAICVTSPTANQRLVGDSVSIAFTTPNFSVLPTGPHLRYRVDDGPYLPWRSTHPLDIEDLETGEHQVDLYLATDDAGTPSASPDASTFLTFHLGSNGLANLKVCLAEGVLRGASRAETSVVKTASVPVDVGNIYLANIYAPIEVQYLPAEILPLNPNGAATVVIGKLRSPSSTSGLSTTTPFASTGDKSADRVIFGSIYQDGHSAIQLDLNGQLVFSNNAAKFGNNRDDAKENLGGLQKNDPSELLLADAVRKRAIITHTNLDAATTFVSWEYQSDRSVTDFRLQDTTDTVITFNEAGVDSDEVTIRAGTSITWENTSSQPMVVYSGQTTTAQFAEDPDLTLYGEDFTSGTLNNGDRFQFMFNNPGDYYWFAHPGITNAPIQGVIHVSSGHVTPTDRYLLVENDTAADTAGGRIIRIDNWGNVVWTYGEGLLHRPRDVRPHADGTMVIST